MVVDVSKDSKRKTKKQNLDLQKNTHARASAFFAHGDVV